MATVFRLLPEERLRFAILATLLLLNACILESNDVVATSGFVSNVGAPDILWVWAADMLIVILTSGAYSLVVDRVKREQLALRLFVAFSLGYVALYALFLAGGPSWLPYSLMLVINDQQWIVLPMLIWALANDLFSMAEAKRLFPLLGLAAFGGAILGNALTAAVARGLAHGARGSVGLLLLNAGLLWLMVIALGAARRWLKSTARQSRQDEHVLDTLREGMAFVGQVPSYCYLALAMILLGFGLNVIEYQLIASASQAYSQASGLEVFYATLRAARIVLMVVVQGVIAGWLLKRLGFKTIFVVMPVAVLTGLALVFFWPVLLVVVSGEYIARITLQGIDEPSRRAFWGLVPDERRGRVSAFMDGYLYPFGSILSCGVVGATVLAVRWGWLSPEAARMLYLGAAGVGAAVAAWAIYRFRAHYDASMLNWRLKRRQRASVLAKLEF